MFPKKKRNICSTPLKCKNLFSILGMNLFGCKFCEKVNDETECDRKNFDSLLWALVTVFQVNKIIRQKFNYTKFTDQIPNN